MKQQFTLWNQLRTNKFWSVSDLSNAAQTLERTARNYIRILWKNGYLERDDSTGISQYRLIRDTGPAAPQVTREGFYDPNLAGEVRCDRQRIWNALRIAKSANTQELLSAAEVGERNTYRYLAALRKTGFVHCRKPPGRGGRMPLQYTLIQDTGPLAPEIAENGTIFDPNTQTIHEPITLTQAN